MSQHFEDCFFARTPVAADKTRLTGQLEAAHVAAGFKPRPAHHVYNELVHPAEMMIRAFHCWQQTRWPGRNGRLHYAHMLFNLYVLRWLEFLSLRLWDEDPDGVGERLAEIQAVLNELWSSSPSGQPVFVRDARWLIPLAQSLITDELAPYFEIARQVAETFPETDALEIQKAHVRMLGGHLASQTRHYSMEGGLPIDHPSIVARTRTSNALDLALLVQGLVALLNAYDRALRSGDARVRLDMAGAIFQGISPDPGLFVNRIELLSAYSMIEHVFIAAETSVYSPVGQRHVQLLKEYSTLMNRLVQPLREDVPRFRPLAGGFSPYGVISGLPTNLIEHMALKALQHDAETRFSLEDVFRDEDAGAAKLAWVDGWRKLPHIAPEIQRLYEYPQQFAEDIYSRIAGALGQRGKASDASRTGRLYIVSDSKDSPIPELPPRYRVSTGKEYDRSQLLRDRQEGHFLVSYETPTGWAALKKNLLTEVLGAGHDARIAGLPRGAAEVLRLMCADLAIV